MQVRDGMSEVSVTVGPSHTLRQAAAAMVARNVGAALVIDDEAPTPGILTERDLLLSVGAGEDPDVEPVAGHMTESVITASPQRPSPGRLRWRRGGRHPLDARHRPCLDLGGRDLGNALAKWCAERVTP